MHPYQALVQDAYPGPKHTRTYRILNHDLKQQDCTIDVHATQTEIDTIAEQGFLVREALFTGEALEYLRTAVDELEEKERARGGAQHTDQRRYGGIFILDLLDKDERFLEFARTPALLSVTRALLGPRIMAGLTCRITMPGEPRQETHWHFHQRINMTPKPPFFDPHVKVDCLVYLDDLNEKSGTLCVMPHSHTWEQKYLPGDNYDDMDGQAEITAKAGTAVIMHTNLWHRGKNNTTEGHKRRLLLLGYTGVTMDHVRKSRLPKGGVIEQALKSHDPELEELVGGASGYTEWSGNIKAK